MEHPVWFLPVDKAKGQLVLTPCPGTKGVSLDASLQQLKQQGVKAIVTGGESPRTRYEMVFFTY